MVYRSVLLLVAFLTNSLSSLVAAPSMEPGGARVAHECHDAT